MPRGDDGGGWPGTFVDVDVNNTHSCAVRSDHTVECWGYGGDGRIHGDYLYMARDERYFSLATRIASSSEV